MSLISILLSLITQLNPVANGVLPVSVEQRPKVKVAVEFPGTVSLEPGAAVVLGNARVGYISSISSSDEPAAKAAAVTSVLVTFDAPQCLTVSNDENATLGLNEKCRQVVAIKSFDEVATVGRPQAILKLLPTPTVSAVGPKIVGPKIKGFTSVEDYWRS